MSLDEGRAQLGSRGQHRSGIGAAFIKIAAILAGALALLSALALSVLVFAVLMVAAVLVGGYLWWKTREVRKRMRMQYPRGETIEGVVLQRSSESQDLSSSVSARRSGD